MVDITRWLEAIKLKPFYLFGVFAFCFTIILLPDSWAEQMGIGVIRREYRAWFGLAGVGALVLWCLHAAVWIGSHAERKWKRTQHRKHLIDELGALSLDEWEILIGCVKGGHRTTWRSAIDPCAHALVMKGLLLKGWGEGSMLGWPYTIHEDVWRYLEEHAELVSEVENRLLQWKCGQ